jgi:hypothetical protein
MDYACVVSIKEDNYNHLKPLGYVNALKRYGWNVSWLNYQEAYRDSLNKYDLIIWEGGIKDNLLKNISKNQIVIQLGGAGDNLEHYKRYRDKISIVASSFYFIDEPNILEIKEDISRWSLKPNRLLRMAKSLLKFRKYANIKFWRSLGIPFIYLPLAADPTLFYPQKEVKKDLIWAFCGSLNNRHFIQALERKSRQQGWKYSIHSPDTKNIINPYELNELYNRTILCPNECGHGVFYRELNIRTFELGMSGVCQLTDMQWLAEKEIGKYAQYYAGKRARKEDIEYGLKLADIREVPSPEEIHEWFKKHHSFESRIKKLGAIIKIDLTRN